MKNQYMHAVALILTLAGKQAIAAPAHQHGVAELDVAWDGAKIELTLFGAGDNFVGFEHRAKTAADQAATQAAVDTLRAGSKMFTFDAAASCTPVQQSVTPPLSDGQDDNGHANWSANWTFQCQAPAELQQMRVRLFEHFPALRKLQVQFITADRQGLQDLTPQAFELSLLPE